MTLAPPPLKLLIIEDFLADQMALFETLRDSVPWEGSMAARRTASYGVPYNYAQMSYPAVPFHKALVPVAEQLYDRLGIRFNNCLLNFYETGNSKMGFHADETAHLQPDSGIAILSLGYPRKITFRTKTLGRSPNQPRAKQVSQASPPEAPETFQRAFTLPPGSLLFMGLAVQANWVHAIKKQKRVGPRISLTWRAFEL